MMVYSSDEIAKVLHPTLDEEATPRQQAYERLDEDLTSLMKDAHIFDEGCSHL